MSSTHSFGSTFVSFQAGPRSHVLSSTPEPPAVASYCITAPVVSMRKEPPKNRQREVEIEVVSQAIFSESVEGMDECGDWIQIRTTVDQYSGWVRKSTTCSPCKSFLTPPFIQVNRCAAHLYQSDTTTYGPLLTLPFESTLKLEKEQDERWLLISTPSGRKLYIQKGDVRKRCPPFTRNEMCEMSLQFLGLPYTWGGRSSFGYDCSGFVQMLYRQMHIYLPRDATDQIQWTGFFPTTLERILPGDLIFFGPSKQRITHVGMHLQKDVFIHASVQEAQPFIHLSTLSTPPWDQTGCFPYRAFRTLKPPSV